MAMRNEKGGGGIGAALGKVAAKAAKPKSAGRSVGSAAAKAVKPRSAGRSVGRSVGRVNSSRSGGSSSSRNRGGGGGSSRGGGGGGSVRVNTPKPPSAPGIGAYLGTDSVYQSALSGSKRSLADFLSEISRRRGEAETQFGMTKANMERDRVSQLEALRDEFASRGLIQSGLFGEEQGRFQEQFAQQQAALEQQQSGLLADLLSQQNNYKREQDLALEAARQEALARRAAKYNIGA